MEYRFFGNTGLKVSAISVGTMDFSDESMEETYTEFIKRALEHGINFFDTAEAYACTKGETILGKILKKLNPPREEVVICTKIFFGKGFEGDAHALMAKYPNSYGLSRKHIIEGTMASLKRLQLNYVDVIKCHRPDLNTPMEEVCKAFNWLIEKNLCFYWGTSEWSPSQIMEAYKVCEKLNLIKPCADQSEYNMMHRVRIEKELSHIFSTYKMGTSIFGCLKGGILSGKYNDGIPPDSRFGQKPHEMNFYMGSMGLSHEEKLKKLGDTLKALGEVANSLGATFPQLAFAWILANKDVSTAMLGGHKIAQLDDIVKCLEILPKLTPEVEERIEKILDNKPDQDFDHRIFEPRPNRR